MLGLESRTTPAGQDSAKKRNQTAAHQAAHGVTPNCTDIKERSRTAAVAATDGCPAPRFGGHVIGPLSTHRGSSPVSPLENCVATPPAIFGLRHTLPTSIAYGTLFTPQGMPNTCFYYACACVKRMTSAASIWEAQGSPLEGLEPHGCASRAASCAYLHYGRITCPIVSLSHVATDGRTVVLGVVLQRLRGQLAQPYDGHTRSTHAFSTMPKSIPCHVSTRANYWPELWAVQPGIKLCAQLRNMSLE